MAAKPYDQAFKFLAEQDPESLLILLGAIEPDEKAEIELLPREISVPAMLPDQPYRVRSPRGERVVHVEAWTRWNNGIPGRMVEYGPLHWFKYRVPVDSYVIVLSKEGMPRFPLRRGVIEAGGTRITTRFHLILLWRISARETLDLGRPALLPFVPLMNGGRQELEIGAERLRIIPDEAQRREMSLHFVVLGGLRYNRLDLLELIGGEAMIPLEQLRESSFYQFILDEGRLEEAAHFFRRLASNRFPGLQLGPEVEAVGMPDLLERLAGELNEIPDSETLRRKLAALVKDSQ
ncbi:MAG: hypothetical protein ACREEM_29855 [Blastocatellia bacterium]